jgi:transposase-like protein
MPLRIRYSAEEKYEILRAYDDGLESLAEIASRYRIGIQTIYDWRYLLEKYGIEGLNESKVFKHYSGELKEQAVNDFLSGTYSKRQIIHKYEISSISVLNKWINRHNGHRGLIVNEEGMGQSMTYGRPTSWKERIEIVQFCIAHSNDYRKTIETYLVSYSQIYRWVKKYELDGAEALRIEEVIRKMKNSFHLKIKLN